MTLICKYIYWKLNGLRFTYELGYDDSSFDEKNFPEDVQKPHD